MNKLNIYLTILKVGAWHYYALWKFSMKQIIKISIIFVFQLITLASIYSEVSEKGNIVETAIKDLPIKGEVFTIENHVAFIIPPEQKASGEKTSWVWYAPTLAGLPGPEEIWMFERFLKAGIAIVGIDVGESFGSPEGRKLFSALHKELVQNRGFSEKACLLARSRGGLMLYNWAEENPDFLACIAGIYPVCNIISYPGIKNACGAYGMTEEQLTEKLAENNPVDRLEGLAKKHVPIFHIHGDSDTVVPLELNSGMIAERYHKLGGEMTLLVPKDQGHNMWEGFFQCQELVDFVIKHANNETIDK